MYSTGGVLKINPSDTATYKGNGCNTTIKTIEFDPSGNIWLGGDFTTCYFGGSGVTNNANYIAKISPAGVRMQIAPGDVATATGNGFVAGVNTIKADTLGNVFVGGKFYASYIGGSGVNFNANYLAKISGTGRVPVNSGDITSGTGNGFSNQVNSLLIDRSGNLYVGGGFFAAYVGGALSTATYNSQLIAKLSPAGVIQKINSLDTAPSNGFFGSNGYIDALSLDSLNNIIIGGNFTSSQVGASSYATNNISKISSTGIRLLINSADTATATGNGFNNIVRSILVDSSDKMIIGGDMTAYKTTAGGYLFRLNADGTDNN